MDRFSAELAARFLWLRRRLRARDAWDRPRLLEHQADALHRLRAHAYATSSFYRSFHAGLEASPLEELPILTKATLIEAFDDIATDRRVRRGDLEHHVADGVTRPFKDSYIVVMTSGSSGLPGLFAYDVREWAHVLASLGRGAAWAGFDAGIRQRRRIATVGTTSPWHMSNRAAMTLPQWLTPSLRLDAGSPVAEIVAELARWQPDLLVTYGSVIGTLAAALTDHPKPIRPQAILCGADALSDEARHRGEAAFGARLFEQYDATETAGIASECQAHVGLHLYEDLVIAESVDAAGRPVTGQPGDRLLVTVLFSRTLPLIRYELTDRVRFMTEACPCGRPFARIGGIEGRAEDSLELVGADGRRIVVHPVVVHQVMDAVPVAGWQVVQAPGRLRVLLVDPRGDSTQVEARIVPALSEAIGRHGAIVPPIDVSRVTSIERGATGKAPNVRRES
jgi:phenylacetate-coenzyme A ligase PaaK-like adenylate-forming protein